MSTANGGGFRQDIQGLRAIAVIAVILDHLVHWPSGGFVGVDVFFVISGFLITGLLLREHDRTGRISFSAFYRHRVRRILPAAALVLVVTIAASWMLYGAERRLSIVADGGWSALFAANWHFAIIGTDYFGADGPQSPLQHFWSLAVEEQFYLVWPVVIVVVLAAVARLTQGDERVVRSSLTVVMLVLMAASFGWALFESATSPTWAYFSTFSRAWELGAGALLALSTGLLSRIPGRWAVVLCVAGLTGIVASIVFVDDSMPFPGPWAALPVAATAAVIASGADGRLRSAWLLTNPVAQYLGKVSYSLYLWHFPVIVIGSSLLGVGMWQTIVIAFTFTALSVYGFHLVEEPIRTSNWLRHGWPVLRTSRERRGPRMSERTVRTLTVLSLLALVAVGTTSAAVTSAPPPVASVALPATSTDPDRPAGTGDDTDEPDAQLTALRTTLAAALEATSWPELTPSIDDALKGELAAADVVACASATEIDESACTWGDPAAPKTVLIAGNSIATGFVTTFIEALRSEPDWKVVSYARIACPFGNPTVNGEEVPPGCAERADRVVEAVNRLEPDIVAVAGVSDLKGVGSKLDAMTADARIALLTMPIADKPANECYTRMNSPQDCISTREVTRGASIHQKLVNGAPDTRVVIDTTPWFCVEDSCPPIAGTVLVKTDRLHMTPDYATRLGPVLREALIAAELLDGAGRPDSADHQDGADHRDNTGPVTTE